jgi:hypothetical protein
VVRRGPRFDPAQHRTVRELKVEHVADWKLPAARHRLAGGGD